jgi:hypothetical protein
MTTNSLNSILDALQPGDEVEVFCVATGQREPAYFVKITANDLVQVCLRKNDSVICVGKEYIMPFQKRSI